MPIFQKAGKTEPAEGPVPRNRSAAGPFRVRPRKPGSMPALPTKLDYNLRCPGCTKQWQAGGAAAGSIGPFLHQHRCEGCKVWYLIVYRVHFVAGVGISARVQGIARVLGKDVGSFRDTLKRIPGLTDDEMEMLLTVAKLLAA